MPRGRKQKNQDNEIDTRTLLGEVRQLREEISIIQQDRGDRGNNSPRNMPSTQRYSSECEETSARVWEPSVEEPMYNAPKCSFPPLMAREA